MIPPYPYAIQQLFNLKKGSNVWEIALQSHYEKNSHHPEHFSSPELMDELSLNEMLCDLLGSALGSQWKLNNQIEIEDAATICSKWKNWSKVKDCYKGAFSTKEVTLRARWCGKNFDYEKESFVLWVKCFLADKINYSTFITGLYSFDCVEHYVLDLQWHIYAVEWVCKNLFKDDEELLAVVRKHDHDKWDGFMIAAYVLKWIFDIETLPISQEFLDMSIDGFITNITVYGLQRMNR